MPGTAGSADQFCVSRACDKMIIDHARRLHQRVANRRTDEFESASQQILAHRVGFGRACRYISQCSPTILERIAADETPQVSVERSEFFSHAEKPFRVLDCSCNFQTVSHDPLVTQQSLHIALAV